MYVEGAFQPLHKVPIYGIIRNHKGKVIHYLIDGICTRIQNLSYPQISEVLKAALIFLQFRQFCIKKT